MATVGFGARTRVHGSDSTPSSACGAVLEIESGKKTEMAFHLHNDKILYVMMGKVDVVVIRDGVIQRSEFSKGSSFVVSPGLVHQFEAKENTVMIEFGTNPEAYKNEMKDTFVIEKGTAPPVVEEPKDPGFNVIMTDEDRAKAKEDSDVVEEKPAKAAKKTKKRRRKKRDDN